MNKFLLFKKKVYANFSDDLYEKKIKLEEVVENTKLVKRPYRKAIKDIARDTRGVEAFFYLTFGAYSCFWIMSGHFITHGNPKLNPFIYVAKFLAVSFASDISKVNFVYSLYGTSVNDIYSLFILPTKTFKKL